MTEIDTPGSVPVRGSRFTPRAGVRVQPIGAAAVWTIGATILVVRGIGYVSDRYWHAWALAAALAIAVVKSRFLLDRVARKAVARIRNRGRACFFGFFSVKTWAFVGLMMGGGITLRHIVVHPNAIGAGIMGAIYLGIGTGLAIAGRIYWQAALSKSD